jgi:hypothetical protein
MDSNGVPIDSVGGSAQEPVNLEDTEEHDRFLLVQTDRFLHLQPTLLKAVRLHPHRGQQLARSQGWTHLLLTCKKAIHETNQKKRSF